MLDVRVRESGPSSAVSKEDLEQDYEAHRGAVLAMLRTQYPRLADHEELYQEAWTELLEILARGEVVQHRRALLMKIAWRRAADSVRRSGRFDRSDGSAVVERIADEDLRPDERAQLHLDADALRLVVESLDDRQATVLKLRFDHQLTASEIQRRLGLTPKRLEKIVTAAYKQIALQLSLADGSESRWRKRQRSLLLACEVGIASPRQRRLAKDMLARDPGCRAMLREMRAALHDVAAVLPMPIVAEHSERVGIVGRVLGRLDEVWLGLRQFAETVTGRAASSGAAEQAGLGGATLGAGAAAKVAVACLAIGGVATVCINGHHTSPAHHRTPAARASKPPPTQHKRIERPVAVAQVRQPETTAGPRRHRVTASPSAQSSVPVSSPASAPPPSPAPAGSTEFGPGDVGSAPASQQPAAAPKDGGGEFTP